MNRERLDSHLPKNIFKRSCTKQGNGLVDLFDPHISMILEYLRENLEVLKRTFKHRQVIIARMPKYCTKEESFN